MTSGRLSTSSTTPTLREVLDSHLAAAEPRILSGHEHLDAPVCWVHSSEIYEIGPLLTGGELLLPTGLGLRGLDAGTRKHYVQDLAQRGVAAVAIEGGPYVRGGARGDGASGLGGPASDHRIAGRGPLHRCVSRGQHLDRRA